MKILILGCNGFIGGNLADWFHRAGHTLFGCDLADSSAPYLGYFKTSSECDGMDKFLGETGVDVCINAAGSGNVGFSIQNPLADFRSNAAAVARILDQIRIHQPDCRYLHLSSAAVYGEPRSLPVAEDQPCSPLSPYGYHKWMSELVCREYHRLFALRIAVIRPFSVYGPRQRKQLLWDICCKMEAGDAVRLFGTGMESRDFLHVDDLAKLADCILAADRFAGEVFNAGSGVETTVGELAGVINGCYGGSKKIVFSGDVRPGDPLNWRADIGRAMSTGYRPSVNLEQGVARYVQWFRSDRTRPGTEAEK